MLKYFLGVEVMRSREFCYLNRNICSICYLRRDVGVKSCSSPMTPNGRITKEGDLLEDPRRYRSLVGKLNYLTVTRPDIAYLVSVLRQYMSSPTVSHSHWVAVEHILCYLKEAPGHGLLYKKHGHTRIECFSDIDWVGFKEDNRFTLGYCVFFFEEI